MSSIVGWAFYVTVAMVDSGLTLTVDHEHETEVQCGLDYADMLESPKDNHLTEPHRVVEVSICQPIYSDDRYGRSRP